MAFVLFQFIQQLQDPKPVKATTILHCTPPPLFFIDRELQPPQRHNNSLPGPYSVTKLDRIKKYRGTPGLKALSFSCIKRPRGQPLLVFAQWIIPGSKQPKRGVLNVFLLSFLL